MKDNAPSATAGIVARNILLIANTPGLSHLVKSESARLTSLLLEGYAASGEKSFAAPKSAWNRFLLKIYARFTIPGLALHQALRKLHVESLVRDSISDGFEQVIILGGGLDTLALRLHHEFRDVNFLELDHPATQQIKLKVTHYHQLAANNLKFIPLDFTKQTLEDCLATYSAYDPEARTVFVCEGVLMYLTLDEVNTIFDVIRRQPAPAKRFIFTFMEPDKFGKTNFINATPLVNLWLKMKGEPFKWGISREKIESFVNDRGFSTNGIATERTLRNLYLNDDNLSKQVIALGESICDCSVT